MLVCVTRNNLSGGYIVFDNVDPKNLENDTNLYGVHLEKGEVFEGKQRPSIRRCLMLDFEREIFLDLYKNRYNKTEEHQPAFSFYIRSF